MGFAPTFYFGLKTMQNASIEERVREIAAEASAKNGVEFVHCEVVGAKRNMTVRVFIDKPGGVTVEDCAAVSRGMDEKLDADDLIPSAYLLEVSSPGLERELYSFEDFKKFTGQRVKVKLSSAINGQKVFIGQIAGIDGKDILLNEKTQGEIRFPHSEVVKANLRVDLEQEFKKR
ncbi:MAG: ribosome maturation factor RimP [Acidobacteria bacterium]|nr:ribosome maturation factor RimP [Acidobacteriota bacterium]